MGRRAIPLLVCAFAALSGQAAAAEQQVLAVDGAAGDGFGDSVAIEGDVVVIGAPAHNTGQGAVYVFSRSGDAWSQTGKLTASDGLPGDALGTAVAIDGDVVVAGASGVDYPLAVPPASNAGAVYTFATTGGAARTETGRLNASDGMFNSHSLGASVAIAGNMIVAGAPLGDGTGGANATGTAYAFTRTGANPRTESRELIPTDSVALDSYGSAVAVAGDTIVVGAPGDDGNRGSVYAFDRTPAAPSDPETAKLTVSDGAINDSFGSSVAIAAGTIAAGAPLNGPVVLTGAAYTFTATGAAARNETAELNASDGVHQDKLGTSTAADAATILSGAPGEANDPGAAYAFASSGADPRTELAKLSAPGGLAGDRFGGSVDLDGDVNVIGAPGDDVGLNAGQGSAWIFFEQVPADPGPDPAPGPGPQPDPDPDPGPDPEPSDNAGPVVTLGFKEPQRLRGEKATIKVTCDEACSLVAKGTFKLDGEKERLKLKEGEGRRGRGGANEAEARPQEQGSRRARASRPRIRQGEARAGRNRRRRQRDCRQGQGQARVAASPSRIRRGSDDPRASSRRDARAPARRTRRRCRRS